MTSAFHPAAVAEYAEQVAFYNGLRAELGIRFHEAVKAAIASACQMPARHRTEVPPSIRRASVRGFPYSVIFREVEGGVQVLAVAHHRRRPLYWLGRL